MIMASNKKTNCKTKLYPQNCKLYKTTTTIFDNTMPDITSLNLINKPHL